jgi:ketosteroid isomerase-like protein
MLQEPATPALAERVRVILDAADRADFDGILRFYATDAVWVMAEVGEEFRGIAAIREFFQTWWSSYGGFRVSASGIDGLGGGVVLATMRLDGHLKGGSAPLRDELALVYERVDGEVVCVTAFVDVDQARAAAERLATERG